MIEEGKTMKEKKRGKIGKMIKERILRNKTRRKGRKANDKKIK